MVREIGNTFFSDVYTFSSDNCRDKDISMEELFIMLQRIFDEEDSMVEHYSKELLRIIWRISGFNKPGFQQGYQ